MPLLLNILKTIKCHIYCVCEMQKELMYQLTTYELLYILAFIFI